MSYKGQGEACEQLKSVLQSHLELPHCQRLNLPGEAKCVRALMGDPFLFISDDCFAESFLVRLLSFHVKLVLLARINQIARMF